jgi:hypothetical protein
MFNTGCPESFLSESMVGRMRMLPMVTVNGAEEPKLDASGLGWKDMSNPFSPDQFYEGKKGNNPNSGKGPSCDMAETKVHTPRGKATNPSNGVDTPS